MAEILPAQYSHRLTFQLLSDIMTAHDAELRVNRIGRQFHVAICPKHEKFRVSSVNTDLETAVRMAFAIWERVAGL